MYEVTSVLLQRALTDPGYAGLRSLPERQLARQPSEILKSFAICVNGAWPLRATATTSRRNSSG